MERIPRDHALIHLSTIARRAGDIIMPYFQQECGTREKEDGSPVTNADKEAEQFIITQLQQRWPYIPCIGEESVTPDKSPRNMNTYWLIDPLDGTREFISNRPEFTVNIALIENGLPTSGVIYAPALNLMYLGDMELGSYKIDENNISHRLPLKESTEKLTVAISRSHPTAGQEQVFLENLQQKYDLEIRQMGSSLKFCCVAEGSAHIYFRGGKTMYWDSAAGHVIAKGAGAQLIHWESREELRYDGDGLINPSFLAVRDDWVDKIL